jgi:HEAT repeat protein
MVPLKVKEGLSKKRALRAAAVCLLILAGCAPPPNPKRDASVLKAHPKWRERMFAAERLGWSKSADAVPALIEALKSDEDLFVRNAAARSLGQLRANEAVEPLITAMLHDIAVREQASQALADIDGPIVESRLKTLARDKDPIGRGYALEALGLLNSDGHLTAFLEESMQDSSPSVRRHAAEALRASTSKEGQPTDPLIRLLHSPDPVIRNHTVEDMGLTQEASYVPFLIEVSSSDKDEGVRGAACLALGRIGTDEATDALINLLQDPRAPHEEVLKGLAYTHKERAVEPIIAAYEREGFPRQEAVETLAELGGSRVTAFFKDRLALEEGPVRRSILDALADMKDQAAVEALIAAFESDPATQVRVIRALENIGGEKVMLFLARTAVDSEASPSARSAAIRALRKRGSQGAEKLLKEAALSRRPAVAHAAQEAMEALGITPALKPPSLEESQPRRFKPPPP